MRARSIVSILLICGCAVCPFLASYAIRPYPASREYRHTICRQLQHTIIDTLAKNRAIGSPLGTIIVAFRIEPDGSVRNLRVVNYTNTKRFAEFCVKVINQTKFPPVPRSVAVEVGHPWFQIEAFPIEGPSAGLSDPDFWHPKNPCD